MTSLIEFNTFGISLVQGGGIQYVFLRRESGNWRTRSGYGGGSRRHCRRRTLLSGHADTNMIYRGVKSSWRGEATLSAVSPTSCRWPKRLRKYGGSWMAYSSWRARCGDNDHWLCATRQDEGTEGARIVPRIRKTSAGLVRLTVPPWSNDYFWERVDWFIRSAS